MRGGRKSSRWDEPCWETALRWAGSVSHLRTHKGDRGISHRSEEAQGLYIFLSQTGCTKYSSTAKFQSQWRSYGKALHKRGHRTHVEHHENTELRGFPLILTLPLTSAGKPPAVKVKAFFSPFLSLFFFLKRLSQKIPRTEKGHKSCLPRHSCFPRKSKFIKTRCMKCTLHFACFCWQVYFLGPWALMISISLSLQISWVYSTNHSLSIWNTVLKSKHEKQSLWVPFWRRQVWPVEHGLRSSCVWKRTPKSSDRTATFSFLETHNQAKKKKKKRPVHGIQLFSWRLHHSFF